MIETHRIEKATRGNAEIVDLTPDVARCLGEGSIRQGTVTVFVVGSTAAISTTEFEPGLVTRDLRVAMEKIAPEHDEYLHEQTWHDDNGHSHVRATLMGPSLTIPLVDGAMTLGTWQQVILLDFDTSHRQRQIVVQVMGE